MIERIDYPSGAELAAWPDCPIPKCPNKICISLDSVYCWPHTAARKSYDEIIHEANKEPEHEVSLA